MESEGDEIKSKQASKRDRTLPVFDIVKTSITLMALGNYVPNVLSHSI